MSKQSTIQHYFSLTPAGVPAGAGMTYGEIAINVADEKLFIENVNGDVISLSQTKDLSGAFAHSDQVVTSVNGATGAITNVAFTNTAQTFTGLQTFANGITAVGGTFGNISAAGASFSSDIFVQGIRVGRGGAGDANSVAIGADALPAGTFNVAIGKSALQAAVSPNNNVAIGWQSQMSGDSPINNVSVGANSLRFNQFGQGNVAIGYEALYTTNNNANTAVGSMALRQTTTGFRNTSIGNESLYNNTLGVANVAIGHQAGRYRGEFTLFDFPNDLDNEDVSALTRTTGTGGIYIGQWSRSSANGTVKEIVIGAEALGLGSNTAVIGATSQVSATIYGELKLPGGLSSSSNTTLSGLRIVNEGVYWNGSQRTVSISFLNGQVQTLTGIGSGVTGATAIYFTDAPSTGAASVTVIITNGGQMTGNQDFWSSKIEWPGGVKPALSLSGVDVVSFLTVDGGANIYGFLGGLNFL